MSETMFLACDFSGIQDYVLGVKRAGKAQAKRLRARSFLLELFEHAALVAVRNGLGVADDEVLIRGGGGFLTRIGRKTDVGRIEEINADLQRRLWEETGGEVQVSLGWGKTPEDARAHLEQQKRRPGFSIMHRGEAWDADSLSLPPLGEPCDVCGRASSVQRVTDEDEDARHCRNCLKARRLGANLTHWEWMRPGDDDDAVQALGVAFAALPRKTDDAFRVRRWIPRTPNGPTPTRGFAASGVAGRRCAPCERISSTDLQARPRPTEPHPHRRHLRRASARSGADRHRTSSGVRAVPADGTGRCDGKARTW